MNGNSLLARSSVALGSIVLWSIALGAVGSAQSPAQDKVFVHLPFRVTAPGNRTGEIFVDRGSRDRVRVGDIAHLFARRGGTGMRRGTVVRVQSGTAVVELRDGKPTPPPGTKGEVLVPRARSAPGLKEPQTRPPQNPPTRKPDQRPTPPKAEHPPWRRRDEWSPDMPLLAKVRPVRPAERPRRVSGRLYTLGDLVYNTADSTDNTYLRAGAEVTIDNPRGHGGRFYADAELLYRTETNDADGVDALLHQLTYTVGGDRFDADRWQFGRFVSRSMPEFGLLDGVEWSRRLDGGSRVGASVGFLPELDDDLQMLEDFHVAAFYEWVPDEHEQLRLGAGFQKTYHRGKSDRDLLVLKSAYLPPTGWTMHGTAWVDFYYGSADRQKDKDVELTQFVGALGRRFEGGSGIELNARRFRFPEVRRNEFYPPILPGDLADNRYDRLTLSGWRILESGNRLHGQVGGFDDENDHGGFADAGIDWQNLFGENSRANITLFGTIGDQSSVLGARIGIDVFREDGLMHWLYEIHNVHFHDFPDDGDDLIQQRFSGRRTWFDTWGGNLSITGTVQYWEDDVSFAAGFQFEKVF